MGSKGHRAAAGGRSEGGTEGGTPKSRLGEPDAGGPVGGKGGKAPQKRKRRIRSPHPGVRLKRRVLRSGTVVWIARYRDPDTDREIDLTLDPVVLSTKDARVEWAKAKSRELART